MASKVYYADLRATYRENLQQKLTRLMTTAGMGEIDFDKKYVAIKLHFGEPGNLAFLRPNWAKTVADFIKERGGKPFLTDCNTLYVGGRKNALDHMDSAMLNGFSPMTTGCQIIIADGLKGNDEVEVPVVGGELVEKAKIGRAVMDADVFVSLTHFKGHTNGGFGGSAKNLGIGCADGQVGKHWIHMHPESGGKKWSANGELFMERMIESTKSVLEFFGKKVCYVNVMRNMSVSCDCEGLKAQPVVTPNVGICASLDLLAIDQACVDLVYAMKPNENHALVERIESREGHRQLSYMQELGMGNRRYKLIDMDNDDAIITPAEAVKDVKPFVREDKKAGNVEKAIKF